ncbi:Membrane-bound metal-dependent hydrolase YdjM, induced during SOS response [Alkalibacterium sp. AK22]|uniref:metal-dependent hydrolase n=1 Tax=Alkalibacterium sp. AK22 TaxID=1229520 RepID=UPI0004455EA9|nr:metal-dependent hydrolase [Alkalibacterium sp. AK22]EXJ22639.1 Membrane-bound metal-dependent hydrolase YdjM, induced during SOS response [Alkalibacterium sp. AK22]
MLYKTHIAVTYATALPLMAMTGPVTVGNLFALGLGSVMPDIDHPKSFIGNRTGGISQGIGKVFGHRGLAHSLLGTGVFYLLAQALITSFNFPSSWLSWFIAGYLAHLVQDSFSRTGVAWLQPVINKRIQFGFRIVYYRTGRTAETIIFWLACGGVLYQFSRLLK